MASWKTVLDLLQQQQVLKQMVALALKLGSLLNQQPEVQAFGLSAMLKLFEIKSSCNRDKTAYQVIVKQYLISSNLTWSQLPSELISDNLAAEIKNLVAPTKIKEQLAEV